MSSRSQSRTRQAMNPFLEEALCLLSCSHGFEELETRSKDKTKTPFFPKKGDPCCLLGLALFRKEAAQRELGKQMRAKGNEESSLGLLGRLTRNSQVRRMGSVFGGTPSHSPVACHWGESVKICPFSFVLRGIAPDLNPSFPIPDVLGIGRAHSFHSRIKRDPKGTPDVGILEWRSLDKKIDPLLPSEQELKLVEKRVRRLASWTKTGLPGPFQFRAECWFPNHLSDVLRNPLLISVNVLVSVAKQETRLLVWIHV